MGYGWRGGDMAREGLLSVATAQALRDYPLADLPLVGPMETRGALAVGDGGGGVWRYGSGAAPGTYVDNVGTVLLPAGGDGSAAWLRVIEGAWYAAWFGLAADGVTDDCTALQAAIDAVPADGDSAGEGGTPYQNVALLLPGGVSIKVGSGLTMQGRMTIGSTGRTTLIGTGGTLGVGGNKCMVWDNSVTGGVFGIEFRNFSTAIEIDTNNVANGNWKLKDIEFHDCDCGVDTKSYTESRSTLLEIDGLRWSRCNVVVKSFCDLFHLQNFFGRSHDAHTGPQFIVDGFANVESGVMVPLSTLAGARWFDFGMDPNTLLYDPDATTGDPQMSSWEQGTRRLTFNCVRFSGENAGNTAVYCNLPGSDGRNENVIIFNSCYIACSAGGAGGTGGAVVLNRYGGESLIPQRIEFNSTNVSGNASVNGFLVRRGDESAPLRVPQPVNCLIHADEISLLGATAGGKTATYRLFGAEFQPYLSEDVRRWYYKRRAVIATGTDLTLDFLDAAYKQLGAGGGSVKYCTNCKDGDIIIFHAAAAGWSIVHSTDQYGFRISTSANLTIEVNRAVSFAYNSSYGNGVWIQVS